MPDLWPVYVASRGRPETARLPEGVAVRLVVEPQEAAAYQAAWSGAEVLVLPERDQGLAYVRQWILEQARSREGGWFWMLDDDIERYYRVEGKRCVPCPAAEALWKAQRRFEPAGGLAQIGLEYQQFAWSAKRAEVVDSYCDVCVAIHAERAGWAWFRPETDLKVDRDFTLLLLAQGWHTARTTRLAFSAPSNGSNAGGLADAYAETGRETESVRALCRLWPGVVTPQRKANGRLDAKIDWARLRPEKVAA